MAQFAFGPQAGIGLTTVSSSIMTTVPMKPLVAPSIGLLLSVQLGNVSLQTAVQYAQKGYRVKGTVQYLTHQAAVEGFLHLNYLEIPLHLVYTPNENKGFQVFIGPYVGIGLSGHAYLTGSTQDEDNTVEFTSNLNSATSAYGTRYVNTPDYGADLGLGHRFRGSQVQLHYSYGISSLTPKVNGIRTIYMTDSYNRGFRLTFGCLIGKKKP